MAGPAHYSPPRPTFDKPVKVLRVKDGDTLLIDQRLFGYPVTVRLLDLDTPEKGRFAKCEAEAAHAAMASARTQALIDAGGGVVRVTGGKPDLYGRPLVKAEVMIDRKRVDIATDLVGKGLAFRYDGGTKADWCAWLAARPANLLPQGFPAP
jgi:endonuclease YncB( thermonuclease family)